LIRVARDEAALHRDAALEFTRIAAAAVERAGICSIALAGGSTPRQLYRLLADPESPYRASLPWDRIHFFWGDERQVPPDHADSNYRMALDAMLSAAAVPPANIHPIRGEAADAATAAAEYEEELRRFFRPGAAGRPRFDLVLLGMGADGHTASLFPGTPAIDEEARWVVGTRRPQDTLDRVTLTVPVINNAVHVIFLVAGAAKAATLREVIEGDASPQRLPSRAIRPVDGTLLWLVDQEAAARLRA
jgi:6-phosphogluconolactonase